MGVDLLRVRQAGARRLQQPVDVGHGDPAARLVARQPLPLHGGDYQVGNADPGRAGAEEQDALLTTAVPFGASRRLPSTV